MEQLTFQHNLPVNLVFGRGRVAEIGKLASAYSRKAFVVTGTGSAKKSGLTDRILNSLSAAGVEAVVFDKVTANPLTTMVEKGVAAVKAENCGVIIAVGGGSIIDCAKGIAFCVKNEGDISDYIFGIKTGTSALPLIAVPTTCGTGSEGNGFAVLTNPETGDKKSLNTPLIIPRVSVVDSTLMETMPQKVLAAVGFDALCHNIEAYTSKRAQPFSDMITRYAIDLIGKSLVLLYEGKGTAGDWDAMALASTLGGMAIFISGTAAAHGMEHPASGLKNVVHGEGLAALEPVIMARNIVEKACPEKYAYISQCLGGKDETDCVRQVLGLLEQIDLKVGLSDLGIAKDNISWMTENCVKVSSGSMANNPISFSIEDMKNIYGESM